MAASTTKRSVLELRGAAHDRSHPISVGSNPSPEVILLGPHFNGWSRFLIRQACSESSFNRFNEIFSYAHGMCTSSKVVNFFLVLWMREGNFRFAGFGENWSITVERSWSAFCEDCLIEVLKSTKIPDRKIGNDADEFVFWGLFITGAKKR